MKNLVTKPLIAMVILMSIGFLAEAQAIQYSSIDISPKPSFKNSNWIDDRGAFRVNISNHYMDFPDVPHPAFLSVRGSFIPTGGPGSFPAAFGTGARSDNALSASFKTVSSSHGSVPSGGSVAPSDHPNTIGTGADGIKDPWKIDWGHIDISPPSGNSATTKVPEPSVMILLSISIMSVVGLRRWWKD
jgi:hypothetical protein